MIWDLFCDKQSISNSNHIKVNHKNEKNNDPQIKPFSSPDNPIVFLDVKIGSNAPSRLQFELYANICPKTAENFRQFCTGEYKKNGVAQGYKYSEFHRYFNLKTILLTNNSFYHHSPHYPIYNFF